jgi:ligand-binding sensor domain-containing protein/two-component sensor histidine kinase
LFAYAAEVPPTPYVSHIWRTQEGLPENRVRALVQTPDGYLWIGTTGGIARFDGVRFVTFTRFNTPAITEDNIRSLAVGSDGSLWAATDGGGLLHFKSGRFESFGPTEGLTSDFVAAVLEDSDHAIWAATNRGLFRKAPGAKKFTRADEALGLRNQAFFALAIAQSGDLLAAGQGGLFRSAKAGQGQLTRESDRPEEIFRMRPLRDGSIWLSTNHGMRIIGKGSPDLRPLEGKAVGSIAEDHAGNVWVGTLGDGIYLYRQGTGSATKVPANLPNSSVLAILEDREQAMWAGTADGLTRLTEPDAGIVDRRNGMANDNVATVYCSKSGDVWLTTVTGSVYRYHEGTVEPYQLPPPATTIRTLGVFEDPAGARWFGSDSQGVVRVTGAGSAMHLTMRDGLRNNGIQFFHAARDGSIWIGTTSGISRWDGQRFHNLYVEDGLSYGWVRAILEEPSGDILVGTDRGLNRFHNGKFIRDTAFEKLSRDKVWSIFREAQGTLWIGTRNNGLVRIRDGQVRRITTNEGLLSNSIFQVVGAGDDRLWLSGPVGISSATLADLNAAADGRLEQGGALSYRIGGGQESAQINGGVQPSGCVASNGEIWFPSVKGAIHFKSQRPPIRRHAPVQLEGVRIDDKLVEPGEQVEVEAGRRRVRIEFTSCSLRAPEGVTFRYKLDGYDPAWILANGPRSAEYDNLPPGTYRFHVAARDESPGDHSSQAALTLVIKPRFYQTDWFYTLAALGAGLVIGGVFLFRERRAKQTYNLRLEERTRIAREMHDTLVQGCVGVSTLIEAAVGSARSDQTQMLDYLDNARVHLRLTLDEARQALSDLRHDSFENGLTGALEELVRTVGAERKGIAVTLHVEGEPVPLTDTTNRALLLVTREAIRNAVAHAAPSSIEVSILFGNGVVELDIQDDGRGFSTPQDQLATFGHFGILGMRERMEQIGGTLEVVSDPGAGTTVSARLEVAAAKGSAPIPR